MEALSLLPFSSWTVLVSLVTQELNYHPHGSDGKWRDEEGVTRLTVAPVHQAKFLPTNTSALSISCKSQQAGCVDVQGRKWRRSLRRFQGKVYSTNQRNREVDNKPEGQWKLFSELLSAVCWPPRKKEMAPFCSRSRSKMEKDSEYQKNRPMSSRELIHTWCGHQSVSYTWCIHTCQRVSRRSWRWASPVRRVDTEWPVANSKPR